jgi:RNA polymerase sigma-70 factor (ECF subfamily)
MAVGEGSPDLELVRAAASGDTEAFEVLVRRHSGPVYGHALRFFGDPATAEDVVQEVFVKVYRSLDSFKGDSKFTTWLFRVTRNQCVDTLRRTRRVPAPVDPVDVDPGDSEDVAGGAVTTTWLREAMRALPPEDRDALSAVGLFDLAYRDAAAVLGVPVGTVKSRVFRARRALAAMLEPQREEA